MNTESFRAAMRAAGLDYPGPIRANGEIQRFKANGDKEPNSWLVLFDGTPAAGAFGCWKKDIKENWHAGKGDLSQTEWEAVRRRWREAAEIRERAEKDRKGKARDIAAWIVRRSNPAEAAHAYLVAKGVKAYGDLRQHRGALALALRDAQSELHTLQFILADGTKRFLKGGRIAACFFILTDKADGPLVIAEGYATAASIAEATGFATVAAMNCGNLLAVAKALREKWPGREIILAGDDDAWTEGNPGATKASEAAKAIGAKLALPSFPDTASKPTDFNDLARLEGRAEIKRQIEAAAIPNEAASESDSDLVDQYGEPIFFRELKGGGSVLSGFNERFFAGRFYRDGNILFEPRERSLYEYDRNPESGLWKPVSDDHIREALSAQILEYGRANGHQLESKLTTAKTGAVLQSLRGIAERREAFTRRSDYVHARNGVIRFRDQNRIELTGFDPADYSRNCCPVDFRPDADCPRFLNELLGPALPPDDIDFLQRWSGLALAGINPAQRLAILDGDAATGKSTFATIVQLIIGAENCAQLRTALLFERFEIFRFVGKTLLLAPDVPGDFLNHPAASVLKSLVGGDPLTAEAKQSNSVFTLAGNFNVLITSNSRLRVRLDGDAGAWRRRIVIIRFEQPPPAKRIAKFAETLFAEEGPGILRWALAGYVAAREEIAATGDLSLTRDQQGRVDALLSESDSVRRFLADQTERASGDVSSNELTEAYFHFCADRQWTPQPARFVERNLTDLILELHGASKCHCIKRDRRSVRGWQGVTLKARNIPENDNQPPFDYADR